MKTLAIINPASRQGATGRALRQVLDSMRHAIDDYAVSQHPGDTIAIAERSRGTFGRLIAVGGDGTVCEVLRGMDRAAQELAVIPAGTGNSLARDMGLLHFSAAIAVVSTGSIIARPLDIMRTSFTLENGRHQEWVGASMAAVGYVARCADAANRFLKAAGVFSYAGAATFLAGRRNRFRALVSYDGACAAERVLTGILVGNTRHVANFEAFPRASLSDARLEALELDFGFFGQNLYNMSILTGGRFYQPVEPQRIRSLAIELPEPELLMIDGEVAGRARKAEVTVVEKGVRCCFPA